MLPSAKSRYGYHWFYMMSMTALHCHVRVRQEFWQGTFFVIAYQARCLRLYQLASRWLSIHPQKLAERGISAGRMLSGCWCSNQLSW